MLALISTGAMSFLLWRKSLLLSGLAGCDGLHSTLGSAHHQFKLAAQLEVLLSPGHQVWDMRAHHFDQVVKVDRVRPIPDYHAWKPVSLAWVDHTELHLFPKVGFVLMPKLVDGDSTRVSVIAVTTLQ